MPSISRQTIAFLAPKAVQGVLQMEADDSLLFALFQPEIAGKPAVVPSVNAGR